MRYPSAKTSLRKKLLFVLLITFSNIASADFWTQKTNVPTGPRSLAVGFALNGFGYYGTGLHLSDSYNDFWKYDPQLNSWTQIADAGWYWKYDCVGFSVAGKGYVALGFNQSHGIDLAEVWEYDDVTNVWTQKADYPGEYRLQCFAFVVGNKAYVGGGNNGINHHSEMYEYDPATNAWTQKSNFPGNARDYISTFTLGNFGYAGNGKDLDGTTYSNYYKYDPSVNTWYPVASCPTSRVAGTSFSILGTGFVGMGTFVNNKNFYSYNPYTDSWEQKAFFGGYGTQHSSSFVLNNKGYVVDIENSLTVNELWEYTPDSTIDVQEINPNDLSVTIFPNPVVDKLNIEVDVNTPVEFILYDNTSKKILQKSFSNSISINTGHLTKGIYLYEVRTKSSHTLPSTSLQRPKGNYQLAKTGKLLKN